MKIDIISGFLGAGKTTLIKKFIKEAYCGERVVLIENEFGEIGVDAGFLTDAGIEIKEMNSGCICCSLVGDFEKSLNEVITIYNPERIVIEPSGVGKLSDVEKAVTDIDLQVNNKIVVVNAKKCAMYVKNFGEFFINQVEHANAIVLSRTKEMQEKELKNTMKLLRKYNVAATMITTPWEQLNGKDMLDTIECEVQLEENILRELKNHDKECGCGGHHHEHHEHHGEGCGCGGHHHGDHEHHGGGCGCGGHHHGDYEHHGGGCGCGGHHHGDHEHHGEGCGCAEHHGHHHADDIFTSWGMETVAKYKYETFAEVIEDLENESKYGSILRAKGILESEDDNQWIYFDYVPGEVEVRTGIPSTIGKICVIGANIKEDNIQKLFESK